MINLLPQSWKKALKEEEIFRIILILGIVAVSALLCFVMMLFLVRSFYSAKAAAMQITVAEKEQDAIIFDTQSAEKQISDSKKIIAKAGDFYKSQIKTAELFSRVTRVLPEGVILKSFSYGAGKVAIKGFSPGRDSVVALKNSLETVPEFNNVSFPAENWLRARDIDFSASFDLVAKQ